MQIRGLGVVRVTGKKIFSLVYETYRSKEVVIVNIHHGIPKIKPCSNIIRDSMCKSLDKMRDPHRHQIHSSEMSQMRIIVLILNGGLFLFYQSSLQTSWVMKLLVCEHFKFCLLISLFCKNSSDYISYIWSFSVTQV